MIFSYAADPTWFISIVDKLARARCPHPGRSVTTADTRRMTADLVRNCLRARITIPGATPLPLARQRWAMAGRRLNRRAVTCSTAISNTMAVAGHTRTLPLMRTAVTIPTIEASPTITVITISVDEKIPETIRAQPRRNNHITIITSSQKKKHGSAAHLLQPDWRAPRTMAIQSGAVCTMWRTNS
jgi:hypothetical protein